MGYCKYITQGINTFMFLCLLYFLAECLGLTPYLKLNVETTIFNYIIYDKENVVLNRLYERYIDIHQIIVWIFLCIHIIALSFYVQDKIKRKIKEKRLNVSNCYH